MEMIGCRTEQYHDHTVAVLCIGNQFSKLLAKTNFLLGEGTSTLGSAPGCGSAAKLYSMWPERLEA